MTTESNKDMIIGNDHNALKYIRKNFAEYINQQECFFVLSLNTRNEIINKPLMIAMGTVNYVVVTPRDIFREAIRNNAVSIIVIHNHPSQSLTPSPEDITLTYKIRLAAQTVGIKLLDHIIITRNCSKSIINVEEFSYAQPINENPV